MAFNLSFYFKQIDSTVVDTGQLWFQLHLTRRITIQRNRWLLQMDEMPIEIFSNEFHNYHHSSVEQKSCSLLQSHIRTHNNFTFPGITVIDTAVIVTSIVNDAAHGVKKKKKRKKIPMK